MVYSTVHKLYSVNLCCNRYIEANYFHRGDYFHRGEILHSSAHNLHSTMRSVLSQ